MNKIFVIVYVMYIRKSSELFFKYANPVSEDVSDVGELCEVVKDDYLFVPDTSL